MEYTEAKKLKSGDLIWFQGTSKERKLRTEVLPIVSIANNTESKPPTVEITIESKWLGTITRPHIQFQRPPICIDGMSYSEFMSELV